LVLGRFQSALATATAMHQLPTSISALALCVRPLLLAGWHTKEESTQQVNHHLILIVPLPLISCTLYMAIKHIVQGVLLPACSAAWCSWLITSAVW
jgi:hypothetical protein